MSSPEMQSERYPGSIVIWVGMRGPGEKTSQKRGDQNWFPGIRLLNQRKCTGQRPTCEACQKHNRECHYAREPGERSLTALKRKIEAVRYQNAGEHELIVLLCSLPAREAKEVLILLRSTKDISTSLCMARSLSAAMSTKAQVAPPNQQITETNKSRGEISHRSDLDIAGTSLNPVVAKQGRKSELQIDPYVSLSLVSTSHWRYNIHPHIPTSTYSLHVQLRPQAPTEISRSRLRVAAKRVMM